MCAHLCVLCVLVCVKGMTIHKLTASLAALIRVLIQPSRVRAAHTIVRDAQRGLCALHQYLRKDNRQLMMIRIQLRHTSQLVATAVIVVHHQRSAVNVELLSVQNHFVRVLRKLQLDCHPAFERLEASYIARGRDE